MTARQLFDTRKKQSGDQRRRRAGLRILTKKTRWMALVYLALSTSWAMATMVRHLGENICL